MLPTRRRIGIGHHNFAERRGPLLLGRMTSSKNAHQQTQRGADGKPPFCSHEHVKMIS
jgi:hypothetical protein